MSEPEAPAGIDPAPVTAWMAEHVDGVEPPLRFERVAGGHSCLTYIVEDASRRAAPCCAARPSATCWPPLTTWPGSTRSSPPSPTPTCPSPRRSGCAPTSAVNDAPFYVMGFVDGARAPRRRPRRGCSPSRPAAAPAEHLVDILVALHAVDIDAVGLGDLSKRADYLGRQLRRWTAQWEGSKTKELPGMERLQRVAASPTSRPTPTPHRPRRLPPRQLHPRPRRHHRWRCSTGSCARSATRWPTCRTCCASWAEPSDPPRASTDPPSRAAGFPTRGGAGRPLRRPLGPRPRGPLVLDGVQRVALGVHRRRACTTGTSRGRWRPAATRTSSASSSRSPKAWRPASKPRASS